MDYFTLFGLTFSYSIDLEQLTYRYQELQRQYHPDRFANQSDSEKVSALQQAATINAAYQALKHPLKRAEYMLTLYDIDINNEQYTMHDTAFLMEQLALREELECIETSVQAEEALALFSSILVKTIKSNLQEMEKQLNSEQWINAADTVRKLRFLDKLQQQVEQLEERLFNRF
ncbi:Co-chaperone protein HscB [Arsenophonus endosymbiont of Aleurodicus floccissimus]|uniref:co-chaperone HscB n=1 Tax=Arsenophonus endosymbiont of Aleurodicus floccissimus TaxID=2152761 RepID=UPI000E6B2205|nr:co-chaperone HscB [Arsenophonus endosymbiont of Aleurodicus floccissimus]SPP31615.1 Co-chaperone protein HscB [Arsenophonus endosymbiont of Aleurodicus floccissimus]